MVGAPRGSRMLKGLGLANIIDLTKESIEDGNERDETPTCGGRRSLRAPKADVNYDGKFHPMDIVTRPNMAPTLRNRSKSVSFALDDDDEDEESSESSSARDSDSGDDEEDDEEDDDEDEASSKSRTYVMLTPRTPDPRAVRHSSRTQARKPINYSKKYHPQDYGLPGYKHRATQVVAHPQVQLPSSGSKSKKRKRMLPTPEDDGHVDVYGDLSEEEQEQREPRRPRKKLKSIGDHSSSPRFAKVAAKQAKITLPDTDEELEDLVDEVVRASQPPAKISLGDDIDELVDSAIKASQAPRQPVPVSSDDLESLDEVPAIPSRLPRFPKTTRAPSAGSASQQDEESSVDQDTSITDGREGGQHKVTQPDVGQYDERDEVDGQVPESEELGLDESPDVEQNDHSEELGLYDQPGADQDDEHDENQLPESEELPYDDQPGASCAHSAKGQQLESEELGLSDQPAADRNGGQQLQSEELGLEYQAKHGRNTLSQLDDLRQERAGSPMAGSRSGGNREQRSSDSNEHQSQNDDPDEGYEEQEHPSEFEEQMAITTPRALDSESSLMSNPSDPINSLPPPPVYHDDLPETDPIASECS